MDSISGAPLGTNNPRPHFRAIRDKLLRFLPACALVLLLWGAAHLVSGAIVPSPAAVARIFFRLLPKVLWKHSLATLGRAAAAICITSAVTIPLGIAMGKFPRVDNILSPFSYLLYPVPKIALLPVIMLIFGIGDVSKIIIVVLVLFFQMLLAVRDGTKHIPEQYSLSLRSLGAGRKELLRYVILPSLLPRFLTALRVSTGTALAALFFSETFFTRYGLGFFIMDSWVRVAYAEMFAGIVAIGLLGLAMFACIDWMEYRWCGWTRGEET